MALGTNLASELTTAFTTFTKTVGGEEVQLTASEITANISDAIDNYLSGGVYALGAFTFSSSMVPADLLLNPVGGAVILAADKWSTALVNYFSSGTTTPNVGNEAEAIFYTQVKTTLNSSLLTIFADTTKTASVQAIAIASAIQTAVATVSATYTITSGPTVVPVSAPAIL